jgi:hypothetical protein
MGNAHVDWTLFDSLEQLVAELVQRDLYHPVHKPLTRIAQETEVVIACLERLEQLVTCLHTEDGRARLHESWKNDPLAQVEHLEEGLIALLDVVTTILPSQALEILRDRMN